MLFKSSHYVFNLKMILSDVTPLKWQPTYVIDSHINIGIIFYILLACNFSGVIALYGETKKSS